jgi:hypothetical protein
MWGEKKKREAKKEICRPTAQYQSGAHNKKHEILTCVSDHK